MRREAIPLEQREHEHAVALVDLLHAAADWLEARAEHGARMSPKVDAGLDVALTDARRSQRRLEDTRKRVARQSSEDGS